MIVIDFECYTDTHARYLRGMEEEALRAYLFELEDWQLDVVMTHVLPEDKAQAERAAAAIVEEALWEAALDRHLGDDRAAFCDVLWG